MSKPVKGVCELCGHPLTEHTKKGCQQTWLAGIVRCDCERRNP